VIGEIPNMSRALLANKAAMVVGVHIGKQHPISPLRRPLSWLVDMLASDAMGMPILDLNSGFRMVRRAELGNFADQISSYSALPATLTLAMLNADNSVLFLPLDVNREAHKPLPRNLRETLRLIALILATGLRHKRSRTVRLIARMTLMMLMMAAMMLMMMWMMGILPGQ
jgi:hypothetical protein